MHRKDERKHNGDDDKYIIGHEVARRDENPRRGGQRIAHRGKGVLKYGDGLYHDYRNDDDGDDEQHHRINKRTFYLGADRSGLFVIILEPFKAFVKLTAFLAGTHRLQKCLGQERAALFKAVGKAVTGVDIVGNLGEHLLDPLVILVFRNQLQARNKRKSRLELNAQLTAQERKLLGLYLAAAYQRADIGIHKVVDLASRHRLDIYKNPAVFTGLCHGVGLVERLNYALNLSTARAQTLITICCHVRKLPFC